jgi:arginyl-tRNA synthetase
VTPHQLSDAVLAALGDLVRRGAVSLAGDLPTVTVERPQRPAHGDYATNVALQLADRVALGAGELAELLAAELRSVAGLDSVTTAAPGFVNVVLSPASLAEVAAQVVAAGASYGVPEGPVDLVATVPDEVRRELVGVVGEDALRYAYARQPAGTAAAVDVALLTRASVENPLYHVQYAHARLCALIRNAADLGVSRPSGAAAERVAVLLDHPRESELLRELAAYPAVTGVAARRHEPHRVARHLDDTAAALHRFTDACRVLPQGDEEPTGLHSGRLLLVDATRTVLANGLHLLGVTAPERM